MIEEHTEWRGRVGCASLLPIAVVEDLIGEETCSHEEAQPGREIGLKIRTVEDYKQMHCDVDQKSYCRDQVRSHPPRNPVFHDVVAQR